MAYRQERKTEDGKLIIPNSKAVLGWGCNPSKSKLPERSGILTKIQT